MRLVASAALVALLAAACGREEAPPAADAPPAAAPAAPAVEWATVAEQSSGDVSSTPLTIHVSSDSLRVITSVGGSESPYAPGLVVTNLLSDPLTPPVASVRGEPRFIDSTTVDTSVVQVPKGRLYLFVPQHFGLKGWKVVVQEPRRPSGE